MAQGIRAALDRIKAVEETLSITSPLAQSIERVYKYVPSRLAMPEVPCFIHTYSLAEVQHLPNAQRKQMYVIRTQFLSGDADQDKASDIASAFLEKWVDAFSADLTLNGACSGPIRMRGGDPTLTALEYAGKSWIGLDLAMDVPMGPEAVTVGP